MTTQPAAAATGLPSILFDRRRMLLGLAAASTAAAGPIAQATAAPSDEPDLIRLGDLTERLAAAHRTAKEEVERIYAEWDPQLPVPPEEIKVRLHSLDQRGDYERRLDGAARHRDDTQKIAIMNLGWHRDQVRYRRHVLTRKPRGTTASALARHEKFLAGQRELLAREEAALVLAEMYHAEFDRVMKASGYKPAQERLTGAEDALSAHVSSIMKIEPRSMAGVMIQAQAVEATRAIPAYAKMLEAGKERWAERLATSILRIAEGASS